MDRITLKKTAAAAGIALGLMASGATIVLADGETKTVEKEYCVTEYGGRTECTTKTVKEEVTHKTKEVVHDTVNAGIGDISFYAIAGIAGLTGATLYIFSKLTRGVYLFE